MSLPATQLRQPPGPKAHRLLGIIPEMRKGDISLLTRYAKEFGNMIRFRVGPRSLYFLNHPDFVKYVLQSHYQDFSKETRAWSMIRVVLGSSVFITSGDPWRQRRRLMQPLFTRPAIMPLMGMMFRVVEEMVDDFSKKQARGESLDMREEMMRVTLRVIGETIMGTDVGPYVPQVSQALSYILQHITDNYTSLFNWPLFVPTDRNLKFRRSIRVLEDVVYDVLKKRRQGLQNPDDLLSRLMAARNEETGQFLSDKEIRDEVLTMFLAGHETTANALAWTWYLLAQYPDIEEKVHREAKETLKNWPPTPQDLSKLTYPTQVLEESFRIYPPVWVISRRSEKRMELGGYYIPP
ncbi:MAG: cytochrome P450, partial [bacterium]|nr:cytochrome P450 [bacterium]